MRLVRGGCLGLLLLLLIGYGVVVSLPVRRDGAQVEEALAKARQRTESIASRLKDPAQNGFLQPTLEPYWGRGWDNAGPVKDAIKAWTAYSYQEQNKPVQHHPLLVSKDPAYAAARAGFEAYVPDLVHAFSKPIFQPVVADMIDPSAQLQESAFTSLTLALNVSAESLFAQGQPGRAALFYQLGFMEGQKTYQNVGLPQLMRAVSLQGLTFQSMVAYLGPDAKLSEKEWIGMSAVVAASCPTPVTVGQSIENDLAFGTEFLNRPRGSYEGDAKPLRGLFLLPGARARELRIYQNYMAEVLPGVATMRIAVGPPGATLFDTLSGKSGPGLRLLVVDYQRQVARLTVHMAKMTGLSAMGGVCAYRVRHGKPPAALGDLDTLGLKAPGGAAWSEVAKNLGYSVVDDRAELLVPINPAVYEAAGLNPEAARLIEEHNSRYFSIRKEGALFRI